MASADELRTEISANRAALKDAINSAAGRWETGTDENWSARKIAEHAIASEAAFNKMIAGVMQGKAPDQPELSLASSADAVAASDSAAEMTDKVLRYVEDRDLAKEAPMPDGVPFPKSIEGVLQLAAYHLKDHAAQIANG